MAFKAATQKFGSSINAVELGVGDKKITLGGENVFPLYTFDDAIANSPKVGVELTDLGIDDTLPELKEFYAGCDTIADQAKKAATMEGADFLSLRFEGADPNGENKSTEDCVAIAKEVAAAVDLPIVICGCKNVEKDSELFSKIAEAVPDKNILFLACKEENYKNVGASVGLAYKQKVGAESAVDINLAKQLNVVLTQLGVNAGDIVCNVGSATAGYGFEYVVSTLDRIKSAALSQGDGDLQMPIMTPVASETYNVKESLASEEDAPEWGSREARAVEMEIVTATACIASGSNAVILKHPQSVATVSKFVKELM
ncbi:acetyl-CoA decarbonylase/synthase delta subunit [Acetitomaculum ruminis DSM 5522]|uniref:Acetyl-CoA decarbonylase/synthase delta subunit n=1 Tax=Acetitomaculum ruminis DSM 5522 TaxID=1120918 RepID=A0A1I1AP11_9FIRM|nr:acetyl-CoA decarbonylase/synthase complex subunit delta [Acetitomaculum ruminis]SFB39697.1 acetyl-CoA decarbonylase/synthase delta subunit [Acetitomaculum ruminis DSM 5522]